MANIQILDSPSYIDGVAGKTIVTLFDADTQAQRFLLRVRIFYNTGFSEFFFLNQDRNNAGVAHFDISNILRSKVSSDDTLPQTAILKTTPKQLIRFSLGSGWIDANGIQYLDGGSTGFRYALNLRKPYYQIKWDWENYVFKYNASGASGSLLNVVFADALPLTDKYAERINAISFINNLCYSIPTNFAGNLYYQTRTLRRTDDLTLSYIMQPKTQSTTAESNGGSGKLGIRGFFFTFHAADDTQLYQLNIPNIVANEGGPSTDATTPYSGLDTATKEFAIISIQVGASNELITQYTDDPDVAYYTMVPYVDGFVSDINPNNNDDCFVTATSDSARLAGDIQKFVLTNSDCNDFDHIQFAWVNSFGFMDYFTFTKRNDNRTQITRKNYTQINESWNESTFSINQNSRGLKTANVQAKDFGSASTDYLTDEENDYLRNMLISPSVMAKINNEWVPVVITDSEWIERTFRKDRLFQLTVNFEYSNTNQIQ